MSDPSLQNRPSQLFIYDDAALQIVYDFRIHKRSVEIKYPDRLTFPIIEKEAKRFREMCGGTDKYRSLWIGV